MTPDITTRPISTDPAVARRHGSAALVERRSERPHDLRAVRRCRCGGHDWRSECRDDGDRSGNGHAPSWRTGTAAADMKAARATHAAFPVGQPHAALCLTADKGPGDGTARVRRFGPAAGGGA